MATLDPAVRRIDSSLPPLRPNLPELWQYRWLTLLLVRRDLRVRYAQTLIGVAWALIQPLTTMLFFALFFGRIARLPTDGLPHAIFYLSGLLPWLYVSHVVANATNVLHEHGRLIGKLYFPRIVLPVAAILGGLVDLAIGFVMLLLIMIGYGLLPDVRVPAVMLFIALAVLTAVALGLWLSALNARFRDVKYGLTFALQMWMFASPIVYSMTLVPEAWRPIYALNPMAVVIQGFRWSLTGAGFPGVVPVAISTTGILLLAVTGFVFFRRTETLMADVL